MLWHRLIVGTALVVLTLLICFAAWLWVADLGVFKPQLEQFVAQQTGRKFSIEGDLKLDLARHSQIAAENVRLGNAAGMAPEHMVSLGRIELVIDLWSLVRGPVVIELIRISDADLLLTEPADGNPNWILPDSTAAPRDEANNDAPFDIVFSQIEVERANITYDSSTREGPLRLYIDSLQQTHRDDNFLDIAMRGKLNDRILTIDGRTGSWDALLARRGFDFDADIKLDTVELSANGNIDDLDDLRRPVVVFAAKGPDIDDLTRLLGIGEEGEGNIDIAGSLTSRDDGQMVLAVRGNIGQSRIDASGAVADLQSLDNIQLQATAESPDLGRILRLVGIEGVRNAPFTLKIDAETQGETFIINQARILFAEARVDASGRMPRFPGIENAVVDLQIKGPSIERFRALTGLPGEASGPFSLGLTVSARDDGAQILDLRAETSLGNFRGDGNIGDPDTFIGSTLRFEADSNSLARTAGAYGLVGLPDKPVAIAGSVEYAQAGVRTLTPLIFSISDIKGEIEGLVPLDPAMHGTDLRFSVEGSSLSELLNSFTTDAPVPDLDYAATGRMQISDKGVNFQDVNGTLGQSSFSANSLLTLQTDLAGSYVDIESSGAAFEELIEPFNAVGVRPGPYELAGKIKFKANSLELSDITLRRAAGKARLNLTMGLPASTGLLDFDLRASGSDVRSLTAGIEGFQALEQPFDIDIAGTLRDQRWKVDKFNVAVGDASAKAQGALELGETKAKTDFDFALTVPSLARLGTLDGRKFNDQKLALIAHAAGADGSLNIDRIDITIGSNRITGTIDVNNAATTEVKASLSSDQLTLMPLFAEADANSNPVPEKDERVIPDVAIPFELFSRLNGELEVQIGELLYESLRMQDIEVAMTLSNGTLSVSKARYKATAGEMLATARLDPAGGMGAASLQALARGFSPELSEFSKDFPIIADIDINLQSTGTDLRALAGNANGVVLVDARGGRIANNTFVNALFGDVVREIIDTINPFSKTDPYTEFECIIVPLSIADGRATANPSAFISTSKLRFVSAASINLKNERIEVQVRTTPRQRVSTMSAAEFLNPFVQVVGTLGTPRLAVDETGVLISGGAAVATGGLSLLAKGFWDRISQSKDPCQRTSQKAIEELGPRFPVQLQSIVAEEQQAAQ